jgi:AcrR family transcriptional regulator
VAAAEARTRILDAARALLVSMPFSDLTIGAVMAEAGLARTVFYRHYPDLPHMAPDLLPDVDDPLVDQVERLDDAAVVEAMNEGLVGLYAAHGPLLRAIDDAARHDAAVAERLDVALVGPRRLLARLLAAAPNPPPDCDEFARLLMATHREYLLDVFGGGHAPRGARAAARAALTALWARLLG